MFVCDKFLLFGNNFLFLFTICFRSVAFVMVFLQRGGFLHSFCSGSLLFDPAFVSLRSCAGLHCLLLGSDVTVVFVGVDCDELSGNKQMAHSYIVVVIAFSLTFEMDVALVVHGRPLGNAGFHCYLSIAIYHYLFLFVSVRFCLF